MPPRTHIVRPCVIRNGDIRGARRSPLIGRVRRVALSIAFLAFLAAPAAADDDVRFRRTTPRAPLQVTSDELVFGVPAGRAWGLESQLIRIGRGGASVALDLAVDDPAISEGFVRIAWYARAEGRPRQIAIEDAPEVAHGIERRIIVRLDPPDDAVAFRIRVLARVGGGAAASREDALTVGRVQLDAWDHLRPALTRLLAGPP